MPSAFALLPTSEDADMERNDNLGNLGDASGAGQGGTTGGVGGAAGGTGGYGGTSGFGGTSDVGGTGGGFGATGGAGGAGASGGFGGGTSGGDAGGAGGIADRAKNVAGQAQERLSDVGSTVRDRAGNVKNTLADALEAGAERLRSRGGQQQLAGTTGSVEGSTSIDGGGRVAEIGNRVAGGLQTSADWLREADLDGLRQGVERQVRENPGRTLLIAVGLGYLLGKAFRR
ncbi:MAG: hypothetical protein ABR499_12010 [Gemmatimonadaceae bacterium]